jgi:hypothetical protein
LVKGRIGALSREIDGLPLANLYHPTGACRWLGGERCGRRGYDVEAEGLRIVEDSAIWVGEEVVDFSACVLVCDAASTSLWPKYRYNGRRAYLNGTAITPERN